MRHFVVLQGEADLAAALFFELRKILVEAHQQKKGNVRRSYSIGVITPYRQQRKCLQDAFQALCGPSAKDVGTPITRPL